MRSKYENLFERSQNIKLHVNKCIAIKNHELSLFSNMGLPIQWDQPCQCIQVRHFCLWCYLPSRSPLIFQPMETSSVMSPWLFNPHCHPFQFLQTQHALSHLANHLMLLWVMLRDSLCGRVSSSVHCLQTAAVLTVPVSERCLLGGGRSERSN